MEKEFVTYEQALALKELGFDEECFCTYSNKQLSRNPSHKMDSIPITEEPYTWCNSKVHDTVITAPLKQQAFRWFREKHNIDAWVQPFVAYDRGVRTNPYLPDESYSYFIFKDGLWVSDKIDFLSPEEAEDACIDKLIELVKNKP